MRVIYLIRLSEGAGDRAEVSEQYTSGGES